MIKKGKINLQQEGKRKKSNVLNKMFNEESR